MPDKERLEKLRLLIETQAEMCLTMIDAMLAEYEDSANGSADEAEPTCPHCGESDSEKTTEMGDNPLLRLTCLNVS